MTWRSWLRTTKPEVRWALAVVGLSLAIRLPWACLAHVTPVSDFAMYDDLATTWVDTGEFRTGAYRTPGYPGFLAAIYLVFGHSWRAAQIVQAFLGAMTSGMVVLLAARVVTTRTATIAGVLHALWPTSIAYVAVLGSENLAVPLVVGTILAVTTERDSRARRMWFVGLAGLLFGLSILVRPACVYLVPAVALLAAWEPRAARWRVLHGLVFVTVTFTVVTPWLIRNHDRGLGMTISTAGGLNLWMGNNDDAVDGSYNGGYRAAHAAGFPTVEPARDRALKAAAFRWIVDHPGRYLALSGVRAARLWGTTADYWVARHLWPTAENDALLRASTSDPTAKKAAGIMVRRHVTFLERVRVVVVPLTLVGIALCLWRRRDYSIVLLPLAAYTGLLAATYFQERFREVSDPLLLIPLAALLSDAALGTRELGWARGRWGVAIVAGCGIAFSLLAHNLDWYEELYRL